MGNNRKQFTILATSIGVSPFTETGSYEYKASPLVSDPIKGNNISLEKPKKLKFRETPNSSKFHR